MRTDRPFEEIKADMQSCIDCSDYEDAHIRGDVLLCEIALCSHLVTQERWELVQMWNIY
jgi:hypothetical protein